MLNVILHNHFFSVLNIYYHIIHVSIFFTILLFAFLFCSLAKKKRGISNECVMWCWVLSVVMWCWVLRVVMWCVMLCRVVWCCVVLCDAACVMLVCDVCDIVLCSAVCYVVLCVHLCECCEWLCYCDCVSNVAMWVLHKCFSDCIIVLHECCLSVMWWICGVVGCVVLCIYCGNILLLPCSHTTWREKKQKKQM